MATRTLRSQFFFFLFKATHLAETSPPSRQHGPIEFESIVAAMVPNKREEAYS